MTKLPADLEALMPEPDIRVDAFGEVYPTDRRSFVMGDFFTADQVREAMQAATERAAKLAATLAYDAAIKYADGYVVDFEDVGDAILGAPDRTAALDGAEIAAYTLPAPDGSKIDEIRIERARQMSGAPLWAVRFRGEVLNKRGEWEWEPMPSSRDDAFLARARFSSAEKAIAAIRAASMHEGGGKTP